MSKSHHVPLSHRALVAQGPNVLRLTANIPVPNIEPDELLVQVKAVALNPSDWKLIDVTTCTPGAVSGCDFAGVVVKVGDGLNAKPDAPRLGDHVFGCVFGANPACPSNGAFAEHVAVAADLCFKMPKSMKFESAASLGLGLMTVGLLFKSLGLNQINHQKDDTSPTKEFVLVYGGSTATGTLAIQLLKIYGFFPIVTCSPRNFELVKQLGAVAAFDYSSPTCKEDIRKYTDGGLEYAIDCITDSKATTVCYGSIGEAGGRYCALESYPDRLPRRRRNVTPDWILGWTIFGKDVDLAGAYYRKARPEDREFASNWAARCSNILESGQLETHPIQVQPGGLQRVTRDIDMLRKKQVSGKKLVYSLE